MEPKKKTPKFFIIVLVALTVFVAVASVVTVIVFQSSSSTTAVKKASAENPELTDASCSAKVQTVILNASNKDNADFANSGYIAPIKDCAQPSKALSSILVKVLDSQTGELIKGTYSLKGAHDFRAAQCKVSGSQCWCYGNACGLGGDAHNTANSIAIGDRANNLDSLNSDYTLNFNTNMGGTNDLANKYDVNSIGECSIETVSGSEGASVNNSKGPTNSIKIGLATDAENQPNVVVTCKANAIAAGMTTTPVIEATPTPTTAPVNPTQTPIKTPTPTSNIVFPAQTPTPTSIVLIPTQTSIETPTPTRSNGLGSNNTVTPTPAKTGNLPNTGIVEDSIVLLGTGLGFVVFGSLLYKLQIFSRMRSLIKTSDVSVKFENHFYKKKKYKNKHNKLKR